MPWLPVFPLFLFLYLINTFCGNSRKMMRESGSSMNPSMSISEQFQKWNSSLLCLHDEPLQAWSALMEKFDIAEVYTNKDYEPYARDRDEQVKELLNDNAINFFSFKDQVIFEENEVLKGDGKPYTVFTPYKNKWLDTFHNALQDDQVAPNFKNLYKEKFPFPSLESLGFEKGTIQGKTF